MVSRTVMKIATFCLSVLVCTQSFALSREIQPTDFAEGYELAGGEGSIRYVELSYEILTGVTDANYADIRVFNRNNQQVPIKIEGEQHVTKVTRQQELPFFPVMGETSDSSVSQWQYQEGQGAFEMRHRSYQEQRPETEKEAASYIIKNEHRKEKITRLNLEWTQEKNSMVAAMRVESSDNMTNWRTVVNHSVLSRIDYQQETLTQSEISITPTKARFLRISWVKKNPGVILNKVTAELSNENKQRPMQWQSLPEIELSKEELNHYQFDVGAYLPINRIEFSIPQSGLFYRGTLYSRSSPQGKWRSRKQFTQYRMTVNGATTQGKAIKLDGVRDRYWKMVLQQPLDLLPVQYPQIRVAWQRQRLVFLAQGEEPFLLAYGSALAPAHDFRLPSYDLPKDFTEVSPAQTYPSRHITLGGADKRFFVKQTDWKQYMLWAVLILGVAFMIWMASGLMKEMGADKPED